MTLQERIERVLVEHGWNGMFTCQCGESFRYAQATSWESAHRKHVAAQIAKMLEAENGK